MAVPHLSFIVLLFHLPGTRSISGILKYHTGTWYVSAVLMLFYFPRSVIHCVQGPYTSIRLSDKKLQRRKELWQICICHFINFQSASTGRQENPLWTILNYFVLTFLPKVFYILTKLPKIFTMETSITLRKITHTTKQLEVSLSYC